MSIPPLSLPIPSEFPLPRAKRMDLPSNAPIPTYCIHIVESSIENGSNVDSHFYSSEPHAFLKTLSEVTRLYEEHNVHGGFVFSTESIVLRMKSMNRVLCWFGFREGCKYTCFVEHVTS